MTPKQKAKELVDKFYPYVNDKNSKSYLFFSAKNRQFRNSKDVSASCVDEIIKAFIENRKENDSLQNMDSALRYWGNVLKEIDLL